MPDTLPVHVSVLGITVQKCGRKGRDSCYARPRTVCGHGGRFWLPTGVALYYVYIVVAAPTIRFGNVNTAFHNTLCYGHDHERTSSRHAQAPLGCLQYLGFLSERRCWQVVVHAFHCSSCACRRCSLALGALDRRRRLHRGVHAAPPPSTSLGCPSTAREPRIVHGEPSRHLVSWVASVGILVSVSQPAVASGSRRCRMTMFSLESCGANPEKMLVARKETSQSQRNECQEAPVSNNGRARSGVCAAHTGPFYYSPLQL